MNIEKRVIELVEEKIADRTDLFLVSVKMHGNGKLVILIDGDHGISIQDCASVSRHVGYNLEEENAIDSAYNLEVSSPGLDYPIHTFRQYQKNINRTLQITLQEGKNREGKLISVTESGIMIQESVKEKSKKALLTESIIPFNEIVETKVAVSFK